MIIIITQEDKTMNALCEELVEWVPNKVSNIKVSENLDYSLFYVLKQHVCLSIAWDSARFR